MKNHPAEEIRRAFRDYVTARVQVLQDEVMLETTLIRDGMYCGRRFALEGYSAVYFVEERQIKLFDANGQVERTYSLSEFLSIQYGANRAAA